MKHSGFVVLLAVSFLALQIVPAFAQDAPKADKPKMETKKSEGSEKCEYTCPMHKEVKSDKDGKCPKCGMALVKCTDDAKKMCADCKEKGKKDSAECKDGKKCDKCADKDAKAGKSHKSHKTTKSTTKAPEKSAK